MKILDMRWQFGGNFQPVRVTCTENWKKCLIEVWKYLWSEVVTEVVDYLTDDVFIWKVLIALVVVIILIHTMYYKIRWVDEKSSNKENLNKVGFKVQDLELKVNILTYKMQYGTWPLPHYICKSGKKGELQKIRLTLTNPEDRNSWIKHLLLSSRKIKDYNFPNGSLVSSVTNLNGLVDLETKYISSKFHNQIQSIESGDLTDKSSGDNSLREWNRCKRYFSSNKMKITNKKNLNNRNSEFPPISKNNSTILNGSSNSSENCTSQILSINKQRRKRSRNLDNHNQLRELAESLSGFSENTLSAKRLCKNNQLRREVNEQKKESDINCKTKRTDEGHLEKLEPLEMEKLTKTEDGRESRIEEMSSINEIQSLTTDDILKEYSNLSNSKITFPAKSESRPSSIDKSNLTSTQETLDQVKEKLKNLHDILLTYESSDCEQSNENCPLNKEPISNLKIDTKEKKIEEISICYDSEQFESLNQSSISSPSSSVTNSKLFTTQNEEIEKEKCLETECKISSNTFTKIDSKCHLPELKSDLMIESNDKNLNNNQTTTNKIENDTNYNLYSNGYTCIPMDTSDDQLSQSSSQTEFAIDEILDNRSPSLENKNNFQRQFETSNKINREKSLVKKIPKSKEANKFTSKINDENISNLEMNVENIAKNCNFDRKTRIESNFPNALSEERSISRLTETISKKSDEEEEEEDQNLDKNSKTLLSSASSEYFSFVNLSNREKNSNLKSELWDDSEIDSQYKTNKIPEDSNQGEQNDSEYYNNSKQITFLKKDKKSEKLQEEKKYKMEKKEEEKLEKRRNHDEKNRNEKEKIKTEREKIQNVKEKNKNEKEKNKNVKEKNTNEEINEQLKEMTDQTKNVSEENQNETKNYKFDTEIKRINRNFASTTDSSSDESIVKFIKELTSDKVKSTQVFRETKFNKNFTKSTEKLFNIDEVQEQESVLSLQRRPGSFSLTENESKENIFKSLNDSLPLNLEMTTNFPSKKTKTKDTGNVTHKNLQDKVIFDSSDSQLIKRDRRIINENLSEEKNPKSKSVNEILKIKKESESSKRIKSPKSFNSESEKIDKFESSNRKTFTSPSSCCEKSEIIILEAQESILKNDNKQEINQKYHKKEAKHQEQSEIMLIDLSDDINRKSNFKSPKSISENEKYNIFDEILKENNIEKCLIPSVCELNINNNYNNQSESENFSATYTTSGNSIFEKPNNSQTNKIKIPENKFLPQDFLLDDRKMKSPLNSPGRSPKILKNITTKDKLTEKCTSNNEKTINSPTKQLRAKSNLNLNLNKEKLENPLQRRSRSFASPRMIQRDINKETNSENAIENQLISRTSLKSSESQKSSKSCIPILKSRLENIRKEPKPRYRSPNRGPLTINPAPDELNYEVTKFLNNNLNTSENNNNNNDNEKSFGDNTGCDLQKEEQKADEKTVIYINIMTGHDQSTRKVVNPKKFLELMKDRENSKFPKNQLTTQINETKKNQFSFHVEQKEREVSVKPSVIDNSTSISDFPQFCNEENRFKIFDVPEELTKEEYIHLLDLLNQDSNLEQLKKMHSLCSKLGLGFQE